VANIAAFSLEEREAPRNRFLCSLNVYKYWSVPGYQGLPIKK
jgi:hypothetical protein